MGKKVYQDYWGRQLADVDPDIHQLIKFEQERQARRFIFIPSESFCPRPVREALASEFTNIYAEGYPSARMLREDEERIWDYSRQLARYRRYADRRFYKGTEYVDILETVAQDRCAELFATDQVEADRIRVNVQPLSGAAANLAIYEAFLDVGDTMMGMDLFQGGHLSHGSPFNISGKRYNVVSYGVDPETEHLDYDEIMRLAVEHRPKLIVAGFTSYPWAPDWARFKEIADACGALLMADIAHIAGLVSAGVVSSPVGFADVISFTTHKTMCGPRGAVIMTTDPAKARKVNSAVFPGEQGGPHTNKFAAMAVAFNIAASPGFKQLQKGIVENAKALAHGLASRGLRLAYGGTDTHMLLVDLGAIESETDVILRGEPAVRILELCGLVANKNTIPGDHVTALATGVRLGTPWCTQRGLGPAEMDRLAALIHRVLTNIKPFEYVRSSRVLPRGKIPMEILEEVKHRVDELASETFAETPSRGIGYPHYSILPQEQESAPLPEEVEEIAEAAANKAIALDLQEMAIFELRGERAKRFLQYVSTANLTEMVPGEAARTFLLGRHGELIADCTAWRLEPNQYHQDRYLLALRPEVVNGTLTWLRNLSDGYIIFDDERLRAMIEGPVVVEALAKYPTSRQVVVLGLQGPQALDILRQEGLLSSSVSERGELGGVPVWAAALALGSEAPRCEILVHPDEAEQVLEMLKERTPVSGGLDADTFVREQAQWPSYQRPASEWTALELYEAHPKLFDLSQPYFIGQGPVCDLQTGELPPFSWEAPEREDLRQTPLYASHIELGARLAPFAGWEMPLWYSSVSEEHEAVRKAAGLFDVAHMGVIELAGEHATALLDLVCTNYVRKLRDGRSMYGYLLDPDGHVIDDVMIYRRHWDRYVVVVNASNAEKDLAWLQAVSQGEVMVDRECPLRKADCCVEVRDLKAASSGQDRLVDLALQGPASLNVLKALADSREVLRRLSHLRRTGFIECELGGISVIVARTGYTGESQGYELLVHPESAKALWQRILEIGQEAGVKPCGLAARDSLRIEAGLPLYGHELAGPRDIGPVAAGFAPYCKFHKPFFVGRQHCAAQLQEGEMTVVRFRLNRSGARAIHQEDPVFGRRGRHIGWVTSCALVGDVQIGLALINKRYDSRGAEIGIFALPSARRMPDPTDYTALELGDRVLLHETATILSRFPSREERKLWRQD